MGSLIISPEGFLRETGELTLAIPALPHPELGDLRERFPLLRIKRIERDTSPTEPVTLKLSTGLRARVG